MPTPAPNGHQYGNNNPFEPKIDETAEDDLDGVGWDWNWDGEALPTLATATDVSDAAGNDPADPHVRICICTHICCSAALWLYCHCLILVALLIFLLYYFVNEESGKESIVLDRCLAI